MSLKYYNLFESFHNSLFESTYGARNNVELKLKIDQIIKNLLTEDITSENYFEHFLNSIAVIYLNQPFYDGNHRTILELMRYILKEKNYLLDSNELWRNYLNGISYIPIIYEEEEEIEQLKKFETYIKKHIKKI